MNLQAKFKNKQKKNTKKKALFMKTKTKMKVGDLAQRTIL